jgi:hypothetical protein
MKLRHAFAPVAAVLASCTASGPLADPRPVQATAIARPLDTLPADTDLATARLDLITTAEQRFGASLLEQARAAPIHLIVKRFLGMAPPPPPGADASWRLTPAAAMLVRRAEGWLVATSTGWRPATSEPGAELDRLIADAGFQQEPAYTPPCPDFGASLLLLKHLGKAETVRNSTCMSGASRVVEAALRA